jgi:hypothetical protein
MTDRRGGPKAPKIKGGRNHGQNRARRTAAPSPGGRTRWRTKRIDAGKSR